MLKLHNFFKNYSNFSKDYSPYLKTTEKSIENPSKNRNISLDFSNTPIKQNKKVIKRNTRTNSFNSLIINQTEGGLFPPYSYMTRINNGNGNKNTKINKDVIGIGANHQKNKSFNIKKGIFNLNKQNNMALKKKNQKKKCKRNFLNSYFINPNNVHISFNTVGNNFQIDSQNSKQNNNKNNLSNFIHNSNNIINKTSYNNTELNKSLSNMSKIKSTNKKNISINNNNITNEINTLINSLNEEKQKIFLNEFKLYLNILYKIKINKNNNDIILNENELEETQKSGGILGHILYQNYKFKQKNEQLESKVNNIMKELEEIKKDKKNTKKDLDNKDKIIKDLSDKIDNINNEMNIMKNIILTFSNKSKKENDISFGNKSSLGDLENISLADNANINEELYNNALNISNKKNNNINKQMKRNKSGKNLKGKDNVGILDFNSKVGGYNFNDEFLKNYAYFSDSWRKEADKMLQRRGIKINNNNGK